MDSLNLFDDKPLELKPPPPPPRRRPQRPLWQILLAAAVLPGAGHMLLGKVREGLAILLTAVAAQVLGSVGFGLGWVAVSWVGFRTGGLVVLFAVGDAALLRFERADGRAALYPDPPRSVAFWNLVGYGAGYELLGRRYLALALGGAALIFHLGLAQLWPKAAIFGEILLLGSAIHAYLLAEANKRIPSRLPSSSTPAWLRRSLLVTAALTLILMLASQWVALAWRDSLHLRREEAVAVEPFYDNPYYGLHLEMPSPGWQFLQPTGDELFSAAHLTENAVMSLRIAPRTPFAWDDHSWMQKLMRDEQKQGWSLRPTRIEPAKLGTLPALSLSAKGTWRGRPRTVRVVTATRGLQHITLWYEWSPSKDSFATTEVGQILASMQLH
jgi:hypothetical protein